MKLLDELLQLTEDTNKPRPRSYEDSSDFESDVSDIESNIKAIKKILNSPSWKSWMKDTDDNFGTNGGSAVGISNALSNDIEKFSKAFDKFYKHMTDVSE
jgi:hypothetical protein